MRAEVVRVPAVLRDSQQRSELHRLEQDAHLPQLFNIHDLEAIGALAHDRAAGDLLDVAEHARVVWAGGQLVRLA